MGPGLGAGRYFVGEADGEADADADADGEGEGDGLVLGTCAELARALLVVVIVGVVMGPGPWFAR